MYVLNNFFYISIELNVFFRHGGNLSVVIFLKIFVKKKKKDEESAILSRLIDPIVRSKQWKDKRGNIRKDFVLSAFVLCANISIFDSRFYRSTSPLFHLYLSIIFDFYQISIIQIPLKILNERAIKRKKKKSTPNL